MKLCLALKAALSRAQGECAEFTLDKQEAAAGCKPTLRLDWSCLFSGNRHNGSAFGLISDIWNTSLNSIFHSSNKWAFFRSISFVAVLGLASLTPSLAGNGTDTWTGTAPTSNFNNASSWTGTNAPPISGDSVVFGPSGSSAQTITINTNAYGTGTGSANYLSGLTFAAGANAYTFNLSSYGINFAGGSGITLNSGVTNNETIGTSPGSGTIYNGYGFLTVVPVNFTNNGTGTLVINSNITDGDSADAGSINFEGSGPETVNGAITGQSVFGITKYNSGTLTISSSNPSFKGYTTVDGGTLVLSGQLNGSTSVQYLTINGSGGAPGVTDGSLSTGGTFYETAAGAITGNTQFTVNSGYLGANPGNANLAGNNTYTGLTTIGSAYNSSVSPVFAALVAPTVTFSGSNHGQAEMLVNPGATLKLDFSASSAPTTNILNSSSTTTVIELVSGTLYVNGGTGETNSQALNGVNISTGASEIQLNQNGANSLSVNLGTLNVSNGGILDVTLPAAGTVTTSSTAFSIYGLLASPAAFATANGGTAWLLNTSGTLSALASGATGDSSYTTTTNVDVTDGDSVNGISVNSLRFQNSGTLTLAGYNTLTAGGVLVTPGTSATISGTGVLNATSSVAALDFINNGSLNVGVVNGTSTNAPVLTVGSTTGYSGTATFSGNNYLGGINLDSGELKLTGNNRITGPTYVGYGATLVLSGANTTSSVFSWGAGGGGTIIGTSAGAFGVGSLSASSTGTSNTIELLSDSTIYSSATYTPTVSGASGSYTVTVSSATGLSVGDTLSGYAGIPNGTAIYAISGTTLTLSGPTTSTLPSGTTGVITQGTSINLVTAGGVGNGTENFIVDRATPSAVAVNQTFNGITFGPSQTVNFLPGSNFSGTTLPTVTIDGAPSIGNPNAIFSSNTTLNATGANLVLNGVEGISQNNSGGFFSSTTTLTLNGTSSGNQIAGFLSNGVTTTQTGTCSVTGAANSTSVNISPISGAQFEVGETFASNSPGIQNGTIIEAIGGAGNSLTLSLPTTETLNSQTETINLADVVSLTKSGTGTWTLSGSNTQTGTTTINGGTLVLDYTTNNNSKIAFTPLTISGGTLQLNNGSYNQQVFSTTIGPGYSQSAIIQTGGTSTISLGALTIEGALNFGAGNIATTTTANGMNGLLGGTAFLTVGGTDWAVNNGSGTIIALPTANYAAEIGSGGTSTSNYLFNSTNSINGNLTLGTLKIVSSDTYGALALGSNNLTLGSSATAGAAGLLFTGASNFTITATTGQIGTSYAHLELQDWGTGVLTLSSVNAPVDKYGTGKVVLSAPATGVGGDNIQAGTVQYSADNQLGNVATTGVTINGSYGSGAALVANTAGGSITTNRAISLGAQGGNYIDVTGGNTLTLSGTVTGTQSDGVNNIVTFGGAIAVDSLNNGATSGTIVLSGEGSYIGGTTLAGGTVNLGIAEVPGSGGPLGAAGQITFAGGTLQYSSVNNFDYSSRFSIVANQPFNIDTNGQTVTFGTGLAGTNSSLNKIGAGTLILNGASTYTGATTVLGGTLQVKAALSSTSSVAINNGGSLLFGASTSINTNAGVALNNGAKIGLTGGSASLSASLGALTLQTSGTSVIDFGSGNTNNTLTFTSLLNLANATVNVLDWVNTSGQTYGAGGSTSDSSLNVFQDHLLLSTAGTEANSLSNINFYSGSTVSAGSFLGTGAEVSFNGGPTVEIVPNGAPVPEPSTIFAAFCFLGLLAWGNPKRVFKIALNHL